MVLTEELHEASKDGISVEFPSTSSRGTTERDADGARVVAIDIAGELHKRLANLRLLF